MVNPIYLFIIVLSVAFLLALFDKLNHRFALGITFLSLTAMFVISGLWVYRLVGGVAPTYIFTAGFKPPFSINLRFGLEEAILTALINFTGMLSVIYLWQRLKETKIYATILLLMMQMGMNGLIMTRDIFNLFVFMEITSIATYAVIGLERDKHTLAAGFKYLIAGGLASSFYLIGTIFLYRLTGTLNLDIMILDAHKLAGGAGFLALFLMLSAVLIELKPFPANGWALDVYQAAPSGVVSIIAVSTSGAMLFVLFKLLPLLQAKYLLYLAGLGLATFVFSNFMELKQQNAKRLLGYSSIAQMGLVGMALILLVYLNGSIVPNMEMLIIVGGLFINHFLAKAGLFWLAGTINQAETKNWSSLLKRPVALLCFSLMLLALIGLPPFPGFWAKWALIGRLASARMFIWLVLVLGGSLLEAVYLLRWLGQVLKGTAAERQTIRFGQILPPLIFFVLLILTGVGLSYSGSGFDMVYFVPVLVALAFAAVDWLPAKPKALLGISSLLGLCYFLLPGLKGIPFLFGIIFLIAGAVQLFATMNINGRRPFFYPWLILMLMSLGFLLRAETTLEFFFLWELMTVSSYFLVIRGRAAEKSALQYILFSLAGAFTMLAGFGTAYLATGSWLIAGLANLENYAPLVYACLALGMLIKAGTLGFHIWLPGTYAEAEDDFSSFLSSILSKAGIFGLLLFAGLFGRQLLGRIDLNLLIGWLGVLTAFFGALMAIFQEDMKRLLAYSSMGQVGYMVFAAAMLSHLGWVSSIYLAFNHLLYKALLFITIAGVISRVGTRGMYRLGGLIKRMPISFISVLIAIIALSGVPPLSGFGGKWLLYTAGIERGWYLQTGLAFFASTIAFLYCFRLIHAIFLGQPKPRYKNVREASVWYIIPEILLILGIMAISMYPNLIVKPLTAAVEANFAATIHWQNYTVISSLGYWNGNAVMWVTMGVFMVPLVWLILMIGKPQWVKQFNIVFAAERPYRPETTHFAYNFFAPYQKALGFLVRPVVTRFWNGVSEWTHSLGALFRNIYTGNGQTYALHIVLYIVVIYFIMGVR
jgi:formate hydrogenlyase subunit 3/multisubunit Na+/H+ antiporter MnhD subunit